MGEAEPTELAPSENVTESVYAWGLADDDEAPTTRLTAGRITGAAVAVSVAAIAAAGLLAWQHLRTADEPVSAPTMVQATLTTPTAKPEPPPPPPLPPPVVITTVIKQADPSTVTVPAPTWTAAHDRQFVATLQAYGWTIWDPMASSGQARDVCTVLRQGGTPKAIIDELSGPGSPTTRTEAEVFVQTAQETYPGCS